MTIITNPVPPSPDDPRSRIAASYARKTNRDEAGIDAQHEENTARAARDGWLIPPELRFSDDDTKGTTTSRGGLDRLGAAVERGDAAFDRVYVKDESRFGRWGDVRRRHAFEVWFEDRGVLIRYANLSDQPTNMSDADDTAIVAYAVTSTVESVRNFRELSRTRKRTESMRRRMFARGHYPGPGNTPYGVVRTLVDTATGRVVRPLPSRGRVSEPGHHIGLAWTTGPERGVVASIFVALAAGESLRGVARALNARGEAPPGVRYGVPLLGQDRRWTPETVREIARNPIYCGDVVYGRTTPTRGRRADVGPGGPVRPGGPAPERDRPEGWPRRPRGGPPVAPRPRPDPVAPVTPEQALEGAQGPIVHRGYFADSPVTRAQFDTVRRILDARPPRGGAGRPSARYLLTGLVRCGACGASCYGQTYRPGRRGERGAEYRYYVHYVKDAVGTAAASGGCPHGRASLAARNVEALVLQAVRTVLAGPALAGHVRAAVARRVEEVAGPTHADERRALAREVEEARKRHGAAAAAFADAEDAEDRVTFGAMLRERKNVLRAAQARLGALDERARVAEAAGVRAESHYDAARDLVAVFDALEPLKRIRAVATLVGAVRVFWDAEPDGHAVDVQILAVPGDCTDFSAILGVPHPDASRM